jgi:hypothetical protein
MANGVEGYFSPDTAYPILKHEKTLPWLRAAGLTELYCFSRVAHKRQKGVSESTKVAVVRLAHCH